jgi:hypothetical protein
MSNAESYLYEFGGFQLDAARRLLLRQGEPVTIAPSGKIVATGSSNASPLPRKIETVLLV